MFRSGNPTLNNPAFQSAQSWTDLEAQGRFSPETRAAAGAKAGKVPYFTIQGAVNKTALAIAICVVAAITTWNLCIGDGTNHTLGWGLTIGGALIGMILGFIIAFFPRSAPFLTVLYAVAEGLFVGGISAVYALWAGNRQGGAEFETSSLSETGGLVLAQSGGQALQPNTELVINAVLLTFGIAGGLLAAYTFRLIRPNRMFYNITLVGTLGVALYGLVAIIASMFGSYSLASVYDPNNGGLIAIGFSLLVVGLASMNLVLDFDMISNAARNRAPKYMEWYGAFGVLVTLVWLYISLLRLLAQLQSRD